ncbi:hypothetical protein LTR53_001492 [Teratosphaeriaceae sp. CCFEE 6253]|nr:hypothetical protein LTR53_001492 [Teratosphaeriaceae sp. CCFEE 6253]
MIWYKTLFIIGCVLLAGVLLCFILTWEFSWSCWRRVTAAAQQPDPQAQGTELDDLGDQAVEQSETGSSETRVAESVIPVEGSGGQSSDATGTQGTVPADQGGEPAQQAAADAQGMESVDQENVSTRGSETDAQSMELADGRQDRLGRTHPDAQAGPELHANVAGVFVVDALVDAEERPCLAVERGSAGMQMRIEQRGQLWSLRRVIVPVSR